MQRRRVKKAQEKAEMRNKEIDNSLDDTEVIGFKPPKILFPTSTAI